MVNRSKISKEIRRRTGGVSQETGKGTSVEEINRDRHMWEMVPGTGTSPYNPPKWRKKKRAPYAEEDLGQVGTIKNKAMREEARKQSRLARHRAPTAAMLKDYPQTPEKKSLTSGIYYKGGTVKKVQGHKKKTKKTYGGHHGNKYVAKLYK